MAQKKDHFMNPKPGDVFDYACFWAWIVLFFSLAPDACGQPGPLIVQPQQRIGRGQVFPVPFIAAMSNSGNNEDLADNVFLPPDRRTLQKLSQAKELISKGRYGEAVQNLGADTRRLGRLLFPTANRSTNTSQFKGRGAASDWADA